MKRLLVTVVLLALALVVGCDGLVDTYPQRSTRIKNIYDMQLRMAVDDSDMIWLLDRESYLTEWHVRDAY